MNGNYYCLHMRKDNFFVVSVCLSVSVSVWAVTFGADGIETFFLAQWLDEYQIQVKFEYCTKGHWTKGKVKTSRRLAFD